MLFLFYFFKQNIFLNLNKITECTIKMTNVFHSSAANHGSPLIS